MKESAPVLWRLAPNYLVAGRPNLLIGAEGTGKSMWAIRAIATMTSGEAWGPFTISGEPRDAIIIATQDGWQDTVQPRLEVAGANLERVYVFSDREDGEGAPTFPADMSRLRAYGLQPGLVVVDSWIDTVPGGLVLKHSAGARSVKAMASIRRRHRCCCAVGYPYESGNIEQCTRYVWSDSRAAADRALFALMRSVRVKS